MKIPDLNEFCEPFGGIGNMTAERWQQWEELNKRYERYVEEERMRATRIESPISENK